MPKHFDKMAALLEKLRRMKETIDDSLAVGILLAPIEVKELAPVVVASKTLAEADITWDGVSDRLIEEWRGLTLSESRTQQAKVAKLVCGFCSPPSHSEDRCCINPEKPNNRLDTLRNGGKKGDGDSINTANDRKKKKKEKAIAAMAPVSPRRLKNDRMVIDSGT